LPGQVLFTALRSGVFARWTGIVALIDGPSEDSVFGYGFFAAS
jgi:hypothetical protein